MQEYSEQETLVKRSKDYIFSRQAYFLLAGMFVSALLIGIARYSHAVPAQYTLLMMLWSVGLLIQGLVIRSRQRARERETQDGIFTIALVASGINAFMWCAWTLATDALDATPWHLGVLLALISSIAAAVTIGKQMLYNHWEQTHAEKLLESVEETKRKRDAVFHLTDDGEFDDPLDEVDLALRRSADHEA
jgi:hypothetical protein